MKRIAWTIVLALGASPPGALAQATPSPPQLPPECTERDADPEKCVIHDGPPLPPIVRGKRPPTPPPPSPKPPPAQQAPFTKEGLQR